MKVCKKRIKEVPRIGGGGSFYPQYQGWFGIWYYYDDVGVWGDENAWNGRYYCMFDLPTAQKFLQERHEFELRQINIHPFSHEDE